MLTLGIDEAGRGPVIGPMVLAGCLIDDKTEAKFKKLGIKDSKQLTQKRREFLEQKIKEQAETFEIIVLHPEEIEETNRKKINLNALEAIACAGIINKINKGFSRIKVVVDCPSPSITKWQDFLKTKVKNLSNLGISCEHKADQNNISVSAASILAKCVREKEMTKLKEKYGNGVGSGYTSDLLTQRFLEKYAHKYQNNGIFRKTWGTWKRASAALSQRTL